MLAYARAAILDRVLQAAAAAQDQIPATPRRRRCWMRPTSGSLGYTRTTWTRRGASHPRRNHQIGLLANDTSHERDSLTQFGHRSLIFDGISAV